MTRAHWRPAYVGVGSNLDSPVEQVKRGIAALGELPQTLVVLKSGLYRSRPLGPVDQPDFVNAVVALITQLDARQLLAGMQAIERRHGRAPTGERWGPRTLDLDLLAYARMAVQDQDLTLPHPGIVERNFVLLPWREIAPHYAVPGLATVAELAARAPEEPRIERMA